MKKLASLICAIAAFSFAPVAVTSVSAADTVVIKRDGDRMGDRTVKRRVIVREGRPGRVTIIRRDRDRHYGRMMERDRPSARIIIRDRDRHGSDRMMRRDRDRD